MSTQLDCVSTWKIVRKAVPILSKLTLHTTVAPSIRDTGVQLHAYVANFYWKRPSAHQPLKYGGLLFGSLKKGVKARQTVRESFVSRGHW